MLSSRPGRSYRRMSINKTASEPKPNGESRLEFLRDRLINMRSSRVPQEFRRHSFVARFANGEIVTPAMLCTTLTRDDQDCLWLIVEAGSSFPPGRKPETRWWTPRPGSKALAIEEKGLAGITCLGQEEITWMTIQVTQADAVGWLELKLASFTAGPDSPYCKERLCLDRNEVVLLLGRLVVDKLQFPNISLLLLAEDPVHGIPVRVRGDQIRHSKISFSDMEAFNNGGDWWAFKMRSAPPSLQQSLFVW